MKKTSFILAFILSLISYSMAVENKPSSVPVLEVDEQNFPDKMKAFFDWSLSSPEEVDTALKYLSNYIRAYTEYYPMAEYKIAVVSHGPEAAIFAKKNYEKFKDTVDKMKAMHETYGVNFYVCNNVIKNLGFSNEDLQPFIVLVPAGVLKVAELQEKGYKLIPTIVRDLNSVRSIYGKNK